MGGLIDLLFRRGKRSETNQNIVWPEITSDAVLNCCEQIGAFEDCNIEDEVVMNKICDEVANIFNSGEKSRITLKNALTQGFNNNSFKVSNQKAELFACCYIDSYINQ